jgi:hypothetical protein
MNKTDGQAKALFIAPDGNVYPDYLVCSGKLLLDTGGESCPFSKDGHLPEPQNLDENLPTYSQDKGKPGDLCPPCAKQQLGSLGHWEGHRGQKFPDELKPLRLFKCKKWLWLIVIGLKHDNPKEIEKSKKQP